jgi:MFS family permease
MITRDPAVKRFALLPLLCALYLLLSLDRVNIATAAPLIQSELHLHNTALGVVLSAFAYSYAFCQLIGGFAGERFGPRITLLLSAVVVCLATAATGLASGLTALVAARMVLGLGEGAALPTATHSMAKYLPREKWGFAQGITHSFARLGNFATPPIVASLIALSSWRVSFFILAATGLIWVAAWLAWFREPDAQQRRPMSSAPGFRLWLSIARRTAPATAVNFCYGWTLWLFLTWIPSFFVQNYHLSLAGSALYAAGVFFGGLAGDALGGVASDRILYATGKLAFARRSVILAGFLGACACLLSVMFATDIRAAAILLSLSFFFAELIVAPIWAMTMDIVPMHPGPASGIMNFGSAFAGIVSPLFFGFMVDITGSWTIPFAVSVALLFLGAGLTFALHPQVDGIDTKGQPSSGQLEATSFGAGGGVA